jgi:hypothetical protein
MNRGHGWTAAFAAICGVVLGSTTAFAQSGITGQVRDTTGAVLPGVTVEATSPALIEQTRTVATDAQGRYAIVDLRPGSYRVTFTLSGFATFVRDGVELPSDFTATVNAELRVGALEESVTVSGQSAGVDVQAAQRTTVLPREEIDAVPTGRTYAAVGALAVGVKVSEQNVGGARTGSQQRLTAHGSISNDTTIEIDGISMNSWGDVQPNHNDALYQEVTVQTAALSAEVATGGPRLNLIPREGGNDFSGAMFAGYANRSMQSTNLDQDLISRGALSGDAVKLLYDVNTSLGGPIKRNALWFFGSYRNVGNRNYVANTFLPDGSPGVFDQTVLNATARLTWQINPRNKITVYDDRAYKSLDREFGSGVEPTRAAGGRKPVLYYTAAAKWVSTVTNKLLLEAGWGASVQSRNTGLYQLGVRQDRGTSAWYATASRVDLNRGTTTTASPGEMYTIEQLFTWVGSATYVTGSHNFKAGTQWRYGVNANTISLNADLVQRYRDGVPDSVIVYNSPLYAREGLFRMNADLGVYAQDSWTLKHLTLNGGVRLYYLNESIDPGVAPAGRFVPARSFPGQPDIADWTNITPRLSAVYDLTHDAKTALKGSVSQYYASMTNQYNRYNPLAIQSDIRTWTDLNHDDIAEDNEIGPSSNNRFGLTPARRKDPNIKRPYNVEYSVGLNRQLFDRVSVTGAWYRRINYNLEKTVNLLNLPSDYTPFTVPHPLTGQPLTIYNLNRAKLGLSDVLDTTSTDSSQRRRSYDGFEAAFTARLGAGSSVFGGWWSDRTISVACDSNDPNTFLYCDQSQYNLAFRHNFKVSGAYALPLELEAAAGLVSYAGAPLTTTWVVPANLFPGGRTQSVTVPLTAPGAQYLPRWNQLDISFRRNFVVGRTRVAPALDVFNLLNSNVVLAQNQAFGSSLGQPTNILQPRLIRLSAQLKF